MWLRRALWALLGVSVLAAVVAVRAHTQTPPQCDPGFACANVDHLVWSGTERNVGGLCVNVRLEADAVTMFRQSEWAGFRRASTQRSTIQPTAMALTVKEHCSDAAAKPASFKEAWVNYVVAADKDALTRAHAEAARSMADPTKATLVRGKDRNWLYTVARVPADQAALDDAFGPDLMLTVPSHWSQELGELKLPCMWVSVEGSIVIDEQSLPIALAPADTPARVCAPGVGDTWFDALDGFFNN